jgi:hypothetical protein
LEIRTPVDDIVNATANFISASEAENADYTPAFDEDDDILFRNHDIIIKFADDIASLDAAEGVCIKEFSMSMANNSRPNQCIGGINPSDIFSLISDITGSFVVDFEDVETYYDVFKAGGYKAMRITMERDDLPVIGTSALRHKLQIDLAKVSFEGYTPNRPIDDIVTEAIDFTAHFDTDEAAAIEVTLQNPQETYNPTEGS